MHCSSNIACCVYVFSTQWSPMSPGDANMCGNMVWYNKPNVQSKEQIYKYSMNKITQY